MTKTSGDFEYVGSVDVNVAINEQLRREYSLWRCMVCGALLLQLHDEPDPEACVPCERWSRRFEV